VLPKSTRNSRLRSRTPCKQTVLRLSLLRFTIEN
jgi:hypothetical protein